MEDTAHQLFATLKEILVDKDEEVSGGDLIEFITEVVRGEGTYDVRYLAQIMGVLSED